MLRHLKEEDRIEMIIRGLLKQPENKRCINCNSLGPQYVCTTFWTFVCTNCSGVHRDFTHRVKSVSMAKFNPEEIMALQAGGNERARQIYFKDWDPLRNHYPDGRNSHRLREFIKHVYIDRKYAGANSFGRSPMTKLESVSNSSNQLPSERTRDTFHDRCPLERPSPSPSPRNKGTIFKDIFEERSLQAIQEPPRSSRQKNRLANFEIVDDRFRDDGKVKRYERYSSKESRAGSMSPCSVRSTSLPAIRPVKEFLEKQVSLTVGGTHKANDGKDVEASAKGQKAAEAPGPVEKVETLKTIEANESGISSKCRKAPDVLLEPTTGGLQMQSRTINTRNLSECIANSEPHCSTAEPQIVQPMSLKTNKKSSSIDSCESQIVPDPPQMNSLESLLYELSVPMTSPSVGGNISYIDQHVTYTEAKGNKAPICESIIPDEKAPNAPNQRDGSTTSGRKELPEELFALNFASFAPRGTGYGMHFQRPVMSSAGFKYPLRPGNPFDIADDALQLQPLPYAPGHPYQMSMPHVPGAYMGQTNNMLFTRPQGLANMGNNNTLPSLDPIQQATRTEECSSFGRNFSSTQGGNPFE